jgi:hypothetical protein
MLPSRWLTRVSVKHASLVFLTSSSCSCLHTTQANCSDSKAANTRTLPSVSIASIKGNTITAS